MSFLPSFEIPSGAVANVSIIDTTLRLNNLEASYLVGPAMEGFDIMPQLTTWAFLVESSEGDKALFDLGVPVDLQRYSPAIQEKLETSGWDIKVEKETADILVENGVQLFSIQSIIWSHWHWDHIGDPSTFPSSTEVVVGPGFKDAYYPGWPAIPDAPVCEHNFAGRNLREITFEDCGIKAGDFRAFDFFGDGSFYLLDTPGHAIGHLAGLARTTVDPDTFVFMGGDLCHHTAEMRPSPFLKIPPNVEIPQSVIDALGPLMPQCPGGQMYERLNTVRNRTVDEPFFDPRLGLDLEVATETIKHTQPADGDENIFFIYAHDMTVFNVVDQFPKTMNNWKEREWKKSTLWKFLDDLGPALVKLIQNENKE